MHNKFAHQNLPGGQADPVSHVADLASLDKQISKLKATLPASIAAVTKGRPKESGK